MIAGGVVVPDADGNSLPILSVDSNTQITAAVKWRGASGTYAYAIMRDAAYGQQTVANAQALSTYLQRLDNASLSALASLAASMTADKFAYATGLNTMAWAALSAFNREMLALADAAAVRSKIGAQAALGFTPVQQGGGVGQGSNKIYIGWNGTNALKGTVDSFDLGKIWTDSAVLWNASNAGYFRFPNGFMLQWGYEPTGSGDFRKVFPMAFTATCFAAVATMASSDLPASTAVTVSTSNVDRFAFDIRARAVNTGGTVGGAGQGALWMAIGY
ncbi:hypothetical protein [Sinorhizobium sp. A49]|uniref:gp53-like domain-containing protein n=1 Tax=Sinorhizobium sp. A49 TaxID=1945861 RepID=UPI00111577CF|nr:hypothetical protein [Sinorhizobium sp. A49]